MSVSLMLLKIEPPVIELVDVKKRVWGILVILFIKELEDMW